MRPLRNTPPQEFVTLARDLGDRIRKLRKAKGLTQEGLAELSDLHRTYVGGLERGERNPSLFILFRLARALGVTVGELLSSRSDA